MSESRPYKDSRKREESLENEKDQLARELELSKHDREPDSERKRTETKSEVDIRPDTIAVPKTEDTTRETDENDRKKKRTSEDDEGEKETLDDVKREDRYKASPGSA